MISLLPKKIFQSTKAPDYKLSLDLYLDSDTIYLKGLDDDERACASDSVLRGVLNVNVDHSYLLVESLKVRFVGKASDNHYYQDSQGKKLLKPVLTELINDTYEYDAKTLLKGTYNFPFQFLIDPKLPESIQFLYGSRNYYVEVEIKYSNQEVEILAHRDITIVRCPLANSPKYTEPIDARGCWRDLVPYDISIGSKIVLVDKPFGLNVNVYPQLKSPGSTATLKYIRIYLIQKIKCPQSVEDMSHTESLLDTQYYVITHKSCLNKVESFHPNEDGSINESLKITIPSVCQQFKVLPYNSNIGSHYSDHGDTSEPFTERAFKLSHYMQVAMGFDLHQSDAYSTEFKELTFKGKIHLVNPKIESNAPPPAYDSSEFNYSTKITREKSLSWLYTNGRLDMEQPPSYQKLVRLCNS
ncbi:hypothetical protein WICPIJ_007408 [Wickerhamomyces pijperi]|uniref:Arrestin-like N-terminal domain-containing protein n=1 Tax=Wickerhamomyces pijperi TaxID=599730 RepID=A0A9P8TJA5_WICPI|nr:hypothetical protein WICPIJ_007408 [Wickerhamomyces pijperi]